MKLVKTMMREDVTNETAVGPKLDALVAEKVMGWVKGARPFQDMWIKEGRQHARLVEWRPSTDWGAAGEVLDRLVALGHDPTIMYWQGFPRPWQVQASDGGAYGAADADTAPEAICRAALEAVNVRAAAAVEEER